jgi:hypothetical protein
MSPIREEGRKDLHSMQDRVHKVDQLVVSMFSAALDPTARYAPLRPVDVRLAIEQEVVAMNLGISSVIRVAPVDFGVEHSRIVTVVHDYRYPSRGRASRNSCVRCIQLDRDLALSDGLL